MRLEPYLGINLTLNSLIGGGVWVKPGMLFHLPLAGRHLEFNAAALLPINPAGTGAELQARLLPLTDGLFFGVQAQLLSNPFAVAVVGFLIH